MRSLRTAQDSTGTQSAFATIEDLVSHLRTSNARYRAALPAEFLAKNPHPRSGGGRTKAAQQGGSSGGQRRQQQRQSGTLSPQQLREWFSHRGASRGSGSCPYVIRTGDRAGQTCRKPHTQYRCFSRLDDACRTEFGDEAELPRWAELLRSGVAIFDLDYDSLLSAASLGASDSSLFGTAPAEALHIFTLDSGASRCFFRESTTITPFFAPVLVRQADSSGGPVLATSSTFLPSCPAVPSDSVSGLHLPSFSTNLVSRHLATFTRRPGLSLNSLATEPPQVAASALVSASGQVAPPCSCRLLSHQTLLWHHRLGHPSLPRLRGMHSCLLVSGLPWSLPPLPPSPAPPCLPCVEGRQRAAPHSSSFPPTIAPLQTLHMDVWGPACVSGHGRERYFLLSVSSFTNGSARTFLSYVCTLTEVTLPTLRWTGKVGDASVFRVWGSRAIVCDTSAEKFSGRAIPCVFLGFPPDIVGWQFYHPTSRRVFPSQDVTFDESVPFYRLFPYRFVPPPPPPLFLAPDPLRGTVPVEVAVDSGAARGAASAGAEPGGAESEGAGSRGAETGGAEPGGDEPAGLESGGAELAAVGAGDFATGDHGAGVTAGAGGTGGATAGARDPTEPRAAGGGGVGAGGTGAGGNGAGGAGAGGAGVGGTGAGRAGAGGAGTVEPRAGGAGGTVRPRTYSVPLLQQPASPLPATSPYTEQTGGLIERCEPASGLASPVCTGRHVPRPRPPPVPGTHAMAHRPSSVPLRVPLPPPPESSILAVSDRESDRAWAASPTFSRLLATVVTDPSFESTALCDLVYVDNLVFATADTEALTLVKSELRNYLGLQITWDREQRTITLTQSYMVRQVLQRFGFHFSSPQPTPLSSGHSLSAPPSDESIEPSVFAVMVLISQPLLSMRDLIELSYVVMLASTGTRSGSAVVKAASPLLVVLLLISHVPSAWLYPAMLLATALLMFLLLHDVSSAPSSTPASAPHSAAASAPLHAPASASNPVFVSAPNSTEQHLCLVSVTKLNVSYCPLISSLPENIFFLALHTLTLHCLGNLENLFCPLYTALCVATALRAAAVCAPAPHTADVRTAAPLPRTTHATSLPREPLPYVPPPFAAAADALTSAATVAATTASTAATATATAAIAAARAAAATATTAEAAATAATADAFAATASAAAATAAAATATTATTAAATTTFIAATATTTATAETATAAADAAAAAAPTTAATATAATATTATATAAAAATATAAPALDAVAAPTTATH
ncbi:unnamed protein product [Closterium sp. NIES-54]